MDRKPEIQYVGQFYVLGNTAEKLAQKQKKKKAVLPNPKPARERKIYVDTAALFGMAVAVVMLTALVLGVVRLQNSWEQYTNVTATVSELRRENAQLDHEYRTTFDLDTIQTLAESMGMIPREEAEIVAVWISVPEKEQERTAWDDFVWFLQGLFEK